MTGLSADHQGAEVRVSPNFGMRREGFRPDMIILHYTGMESGIAAEEWLCDPVSEVSSHYLVHEDGRIVQMVAEKDRAWHAGRSSWKGVTDINSCSIGIEIVNRGHTLGYTPFPALQIDSVMSLCKGIVSRHGIAPERILAHSDVAPGRKVDPGELFPWGVLAAAKVGHFVAAQPLPRGRFLQLGDRGKRVEAVQSMLMLYGYGVEITGVFDELTRTVVSAFQRHFRPSCVDGIADRTTVETLERLLKSLTRDGISIA